MLGGIRPQQHVLIKHHGVVNFTTSGNVSKLISCQQNQPLVEVMAALSGSLHLTELKATATRADYHGLFFFHP